MDRRDEIARPFLGASLLEILYRGKAKSEPFDRLLHTNPALLSIQFSLAQVLLDAGIQPDLLLGYGLGEITASAVAGLVELDHALRLVIGMARLIEEKIPPLELIAVEAATENRDGFPSPPDRWGLHTRLVDPIAVEGLLEVGDFIFIDAGPSGTLATYLEHLLPPDSRSIALRMMNPPEGELLFLELLNESMGRLMENRTLKPAGKT